MNIKEIEVFSMLCEVIDEQEKLSVDILGKLEDILERLSNNENREDIIQIVKKTITSMQSQDIHRQKVERIANIIHPQNTKFAKAKHITADEINDLVSNDEIEALIKEANNS
jgi:arsenate reductase-like glutaredoxin family protein